MNDFLFLSDKLKFRSQFKYTSYLPPLILDFFNHAYSNGNPLQYSCLENPMDGGAWKAVVHGVAEGQTQLSDFTFTFVHWRRKRQPTPVFLPGKSQGRRGLVGCCLWGHTESDTTEVTQQQQQQQQHSSRAYYVSDSVRRGSGSFISCYYHHSLCYR